MTGCYFSFSFRWTTRKFRLSWWSFIWEAKQPWVIRGNLTFRHTHTQESHQKLLLKTQPERLMTLQDKYSFRFGSGIVPAFAKQGPAEHCKPTRHQSTMAVQQLCVGGWMSDGQFLRDEKVIVRAAFFQNRFFHLLSFCGQWERRAAATVANDTQWMWWRSQEEAVAVPVVTGCSGSRRRPDFPSPDVSLSLVTTSQQWFHTLFRWSSCIYIYLYNFFGYLFLSLTDSLLNNGQLCNQKTFISRSLIVHSHTNLWINVHTV